MISLFQKTFQIFKQYFMPWENTIFLEFISKHQVRKSFDPETTLNLDVS
jgi:hypothetical protein